MRFFRYWKFPSRIPLFWRVQIGGWLAVSIFTFPLKWISLEDIPSSALVSLFRDGMGFFVTAAMRQIYLRFNWEPARLPTLGCLMAAVSLAGGTVLTGFSLAFHEYLDLQEEKVFTPAVIFVMFYFRVGLCAAWSLLYFIFKLMRDNADRSIQLARTERDLAKAELHLLRAQMDPHFFYNAMNTILAGIGKSNEPLKTLVRSLSRYFRFSLETRNDERVPLGKEFDAISGYLAVEKARFREKLEVECRIDEEARDALVPGIVIQPLVENAIKYGRRTSPRPLIVHLIVSSLGAEEVQVEVSNTGKWIEPSTANKVGGVGLENLKGRLSLLYPDSHSFRVSHEDGWVTVQIRIAVTP